MVKKEKGKNMKHEPWNKRPSESTRGEETQEETGKERGDRAAAAADKDWQEIL